MCVFTSFVVVDAVGLTLGLIAHVVDVVFFVAILHGIFQFLEVHSLLSATHFDHGLSESCITDEPVVNTQEFSLLAFLFELIRDEVLVIPFFLPVSVTVGSTFLDVVVGNRKKVKN